MSAEFYDPAQGRRRAPVVERLLRDNPDLVRMEKLVVSRADYAVLLDGETLQPGTSFHLMGVPVEPEPAPLFGWASARLANTDEPPKVPPLTVDKLVDVYNQIKAQQDAEQEAWLAEKRKPTGCTVCDWLHNCELKLYEEMVASRARSPEFRGMPVPRYKATAEHDCTATSAPP